MPFDSLLKLDYMKWIYLLNRFDNPNPARKIAKALDDKRLEFSILQREPEGMAWLEVAFSKPVTAGEYEDVGTSNLTLHTSSIAHGTSFSTVKTPEPGRVDQLYCERFWRQVHVLTGFWVRETDELSENATFGWNRSVKIAPELATRTLVVPLFQKH
ncbi:hypothetical protein BU17DRAFT_72285 [Hysterangium stoloniferum]|nr:hypothetical protein BU17DRAFT_72285 [Hysterangium stoloniferum]